MKKTISPELRLALTLHYLTTGQNFFILHTNFHVGKSTVATIIVGDVCIAIWDVLSPVYLRLPVSLTNSSMLKVAGDSRRCRT